MELLDRIERTYRAFEIDPARRGALAVLRALMPCWRFAFTQGADRAQILQDIEEVKKHLDQLTKELELHPSQQEQLASTTTENLVSWYVGSRGTDYDSPGYENVNGFRVDDIEAELRKRGVNPHTLHG